MNYDYSFGNLSDESKEKLAGIRDEYGNKYFKSLVVAPNFSDLNKLRAPTGFALAVENNSPVYSSAFQPKTMFYGTIALSLGSDVRLKSSGKNDTLNDLFIYTHADNLLSTINSKVDSSVTGGLQGGSGAYAGLFKSTIRGPDGFTDNYWAVVQATNTEASEDVYRLIEEAEFDNDATWNSLFGGENRNITSLQEKCEDTRKSILSSVLDSFDIQQRDFSEPTITTETNVVCRDYKTDSMVWYSSTTPVQKIKNGIIMNEKPKCGPTILVTRKDGHSEFGKAWTVPENSYSMFPYGTGRESVRSKITSDIGSQFTWNGKDSAEDTHWLLAGNTYRTRSRPFRELENKLGYNQKWGKINLRPCFVKLSV